MTLIAMNTSQLSLANESALIASQKVEFNGDELESKTYRLDFGQWLEQQRGKIDVDCGCVSTETFMHWLRVAYEAGNYPDIPDSSVPGPGKGVTGERIRIKPHVYRELVNRLHDTAISVLAPSNYEKELAVFWATLLHQIIINKPRKAPERCHLEAALNIKPGHTLGIIDALLVHKMARALLPLVDAGDTSEGEV
ncbi:phage protein (plasmid) [Escherichia coli]|nr:phage protein [Escherichia coli]